MVFAVQDLLICQQGQVLIIQLIVNLYHTEFARILLLCLVSGECYGFVALYVGIFLIYSPVVNNLIPGI